MIGRLHVKAAVLATLALAAPLASPASAQVDPDASVALVECSSGGLQVPGLVNPTVFLSKDVELNVQGLDCLDILQLLIAEGFSANGLVNPTQNTASGENQGLGTQPAGGTGPLPSPGITVVLGIVKFYWQFYRGPTFGGPQPEPPT